ncbi:uncharacterized protein LOC134848336 [Symsagittifera roscoffensis]|uniref:uncharacterized protein LOC134848336 n=1 Tax=Symsagittifera roscoffensis TaxID=84072 RepID=UPI00307CA651
MPALPESHAPGSSASDAQQYFDAVVPRWQSSPLNPLFLQRKDLLIGSRSFDKFIASRRLYWETHDEKFQIQYDPQERRKKRAKETNTEKTAMFFLQTCHAMMCELLENSPALWRRRFQRVLDLCCAPGGFCNALLTRFPDVKIDAHTLHPDDGGAPMITKHSRLNCQYNDVIELSVNQSFKTLIRYDMVILGGAWAAYVDENGVEQQETESRVFYPNLKLKFAELHIMLQCLRPNGVAIVKLPLKFENLTGTMVWIILEKIFKHVEPFRPSCNSCSSLWSHSFVYMICHDLRSKEIREEYIRKLKRYLDLCRETRADFVNDFLEEQEVLEQVVGKEEKIWEQMAQTYKDKLYRLKQR